MGIGESDGKMQKIGIILAGPPGDMATRILNFIKGDEGIELAKLGIFSTEFPLVLTGEKIKGRIIDDEFVSEYLTKNKIMLIRPYAHDLLFKSIKDEYKDSLIGINFADASGYDVNFKFVEAGIPFISGVTGAPKEKESELEKAVKGSSISAVIDKNMSVPLVLVGAALEYLADTFPNALEGFSGYGIDSHQTGKKDAISGTLVKWNDSFKQLGINFYMAQGDRTAAYGHGHHHIRIVNPDGNVRLTIDTEVDGRDPYAQVTVNKVAPFLYRKKKEGSKGQVYSMIDVLKGE